MRRETLYTSSRDQLRGDHIALYLVGALADDHQRGVAEVAFDVVLGGIAVAAVDSDCIERYLHRHFGGEQLGHPGLHVTAVPAVELFRGIPRELPRSRQLGSHVGQIVADRLMFPDRPPEALPLLGIAEGVLKRGRRDTQCPRRDLNTSGLKTFHHLPKATAGYATEDRRCRHPVVVEA